MTPKISVVTGTRNRPKALKRFIDSLAATCTVPTELVLADASDVMAELPFKVSLSDTGLCCIHHIHEQPRLGTLKGYNRAFRECTGEYVGWFNDDCECLPHWDWSALRFMEASPDVGLGCIYFKDNYSYPAEQSLFYCQKVYGLPYANFGFIRRELGNQLGWFDERVGWMYGCDTALSFAVIDAGYAVAPIPDCKVLHYREQDEVRRENYRIALTDNLANNDNAKFKAIWTDERIAGLRHKHAKYDHYLSAMGMA